MEESPPKYANPVHYEHMHQLTFILCYRHGNYVRRTGSNCFCVLLGNIYWYLTASKSGTPGIPNLSCPNLAATTASSTEASFAAAKLTNLPNRYTSSYVALTAFQNVNHT